MILEPITTTTIETVQPLKLVISGPVGAGKTAFVKSLSETEVVETDELASEDIGKTMTTVAFDFGTLNLDGQPIHLFGTPGQDRFDFMWDMLCEGALGLILLVAVISLKTSRTPDAFSSLLPAASMCPLWLESPVKI